MYEWETAGIGNLKFGVIDIDSEKPNGYAVGKKWMEVTTLMWLKDIKSGLLYEWELYSDGRYPCWWLDEILHRKLKA
jgi:hypothetical protein